VLAEHSNPHTFRKTLARFGQQICRSPEEYKAFSQNLGHEDVLTTFTSYGAVPVDQQASIIRSLCSRNAEAADSAELAHEIIDLISRRKRA
jgi:integrase